ncbi:hypothetical protein BKA58DRAFT_413283 [Alternaria rosae]|uniref:uncharacterized protein n=1 Tax=Alternaria rosae TaxID=1187941 RepID=UPI001E8D3F8D|nr:uncharacterized protein BKA58DRAFT_413283 [Alternaria rosae]KAH6865575.1 hypothetical protein BKA58DRAFT_413283 [Alternaria rosae]
MDASTRLYKRLGEIPEDPNDPESLDDLIVCAFGAFERYYVCWKTKGGEFRQDGYDLPPALKDWLYPNDGTTRDFASLQVVFGRGEEYFASDKNGKLEYKEPELKKQAPTEDEEKLDRQALRRSRTVSFLRPLSETSIRSDSGVSDTNRSKRSSSISSQRASRPPSLSYTSSRTNSDISLLGETIVEGQMRQPGRPSYISQWTALGSSAGELEQVASPQVSDDRIHTESVMEREGKMESMKTASPASVATTPLRPTVASNTMILQRSPPPRRKPTSNTPSCTCNCHTSQSPPKSTYTTTATQTSPPPSPLHRDNPSSSYWPSQANYSAIPQDPSYYTDEEYDTPPVFMGRMSTYFSKPGYQLGDSLFSGYQPIDWGSGYEEVEVEGDS